jgi:hypothetical protein
MQSVRGMLFTQFRKRIPAAVEKYEHGSDMMSGADAEKNIDPLYKTFGILLP